MDSHEVKSVSTPSDLVALLCRPRRRGRVEYDRQIASSGERPSRGLGDQQRISPLPVDGPTAITAASRSTRVIRYASGVTMIMIGSAAHACHDQRLHEL